ncbi:hypothetical protein AVEN_130201-1 [Araneus ventricosus]|uniref:Uncharacterized protein n=1 Tax=Araneus ventricosus TaxID=182803 RepID=A0A4Y2L2K4_ARAVE|nr:hypothetical protein AVEN_130201-1 [Araneus ventricosus]
MFLCKLQVRCHRAFPYGDWSALGNAPFPVKLCFLPYSDKNALKQSYLPLGKFVCHKSSDFLLVEMKSFQSTRSVVFSGRRFNFECDISWNKVNIREKLLLYFNSTISIISMVVLLRRWQNHRSHFSIGGQVGLVYWILDLPNFVASENFRSRRHHSS